MPQGKSGYVVNAITRLRRRLTQIRVCFGTLIVPNWSAQNGTGAVKDIQNDMQQENAMPPDCELPALVEKAILRRHIYALRRLLLNQSVPDRHAREAAAQRLTALYQLDPLPESQRRLSDE
jgi:hypothetical protein